MKNILNLLLIIATLATTSCTGSASEGEAVVGDTLQLRHASLLTIVECDGYTVTDIKSPWSGKLLHRYILVDKNSNVPADIPRGTLLRTPLDSLLVFSTVHAELICNLGRADAVTGVCEGEYMTQPALKERISNGRITDCGSSLNINSERVVQLSPQAIWVLPYENGGYGKLERMHYPLIECAEYMENSPLGGAEWMRFYGRLLGEGKRADSLFNVVENNYIALRDRVSKCKRRPTLMCELKSSSAWYMPGGNSTMGQLYNDAGANYLFACHDRTGSLPLAFETVLNRAADADFWFIKYGGVRKTYKSLLTEFDGYAHFRPYKERNIYECRLSEKRFYEETPFRPDILLQEFISIIHPEIIEDYELRYYEKMQEE